MRGIYDLMDNNTTYMFRFVVLRKYGSHNGEGIANRSYYNTKNIQ